MYIEKVNTPQDIKGLNSSFGSKIERQISQ